MPGLQEIPSRGSSRFVVLEPETWIGKPLPILSEVDSPAMDLKHGEWRLFLISHACSRCESFLAEHFSAARRDRQGFSAENMDHRDVVLDLADGWSVELGDIARQVPVMHMKGGKEYFSELPVELKLSDGRVEGVTRVGHE